MPLKVERDAGGNIVRTTYVALDGSERVISSKEPVDPLAVAWNEAQQRSQPEPGSPPPPSEMGDLLEASLPVPASLGLPPVLAEQLDRETREGFDGQKLLPAPPGRVKIMGEWIPRWLIERNFPGLSVRQIMAIPGIERAILRLRGCRCHNPAYLVLSRGPARAMQVCKWATKVELAQRGTDRAIRYLHDLIADTINKPPPWAREEAL